MRPIAWLLSAWLGLGLALTGTAAEPSASPRPRPMESFPPPEDRGGWPSLLPEAGEPDAEGKAEIRRVAGVDWEKLREAWRHNASAPGATGLLVIRKGTIVGEWYRDADRATPFNIYSSSKAYTSTAFGLILADFGNAPLPDGRTLTLDTKACTAEWLPETLPLPDPRKAEITVRHLLNMASGLTEEGPPKERPFEWALGHVEGSPMARLKADPGREFHYSNAGVAHLVLLFHRATGTDLFPFLKGRLMDPIGMGPVQWQQVGGAGGIGPFSQGYSGLQASPRQHARFCYLALHRGVWAGRRIVPESYYDFAWRGTGVKPEYGAQWWVWPRVPGAPRDLVMTLGRDHNDGFVCPSLDLVFVRLGDGSKFPPDFETDLVRKVLDAVEPQGHGERPAQGDEDFRVEEGFRSLFNGSDLSGWRLNGEPLDGRAATADGRFRAEGGRIVITGGPKIEDLYTVGEFNEDFVLRLEFRASPKANSGLYLRGKQLQVRDYATIGPYKGLEKFNEGGWNAVEVRVKAGPRGDGALAECRCNGEVLEPALPVPARGGIGLQSETNRIEYRRIRIGTPP
jgi:CubicO group peptidase (beta-lactamase class C family)